MSKEDTSSRSGPLPAATVGTPLRLDDLPSQPSILVYPSRTAKGGRFDCSVMSLSLLLDYRQEDNKEHSFEVGPIGQCCCSLSLFIERREHRIPDLYLPIEECTGFAALEQVFPRSFPAAFILNGRYSAA